MDTRSGPTPKELLPVLQSHRNCGWITCDWQPRAHDGAPTVEELDDFVYRALGDEASEEHKGAYREISSAEARELVAHWMRHSMAYGLILTGSDDASESTEPFFHAFSESVRYFTNFKQLSPDAATFAPKSLHTFDAGIVAVDAAKIGLLWFADED